jgi:hypothetical protein
MLNKYTVLCRLGIVFIFLFVFGYQGLSEMLDGYARVTVDTTNGPVTVVLPRREYHFSPSGNAYFLATDGNDANNGTMEKPWRTFAFALEQLQPGDLLYVRGGDYPEPFTIHKSGTLFRPIILSNYPGEQPRIIQPQGWQSTNINQASITLQAVTNVWIHGFIVEGCLGQPDSPPQDGFGQNCISFLSGAGEGCRILNNICRNAQHCGIKELGHGGIDFLIEGNLIFNNGKHRDGFPDPHGVYIPSKGKSGIIIRGNAVFNNAGYGFHFYVFPKNLHVYNNICFNNPGAGIIMGGWNSTFAHNVLALNRFCGIYLFRGGCSNNVFVNNLCISNTPSQLGMDNGGGDPIYGTPNNNIVDYCVLFPASTWSSPSDWFSGIAGSHLIIEDPIVTDGTAHDYRLSNTSPARNAAGPVVMLGAHAQPDIGLFPATQYWEPIIAPLTDQIIEEGKELRLSVILAETNSLAHSCSFAIDESAPLGAAINPQSGAFTWTPNEAHGPGTYKITVGVIADGSPFLINSKTFQVIVLEVNDPPVIQPVPNQQIEVLSRLGVQISAIDDHITTNPLSFSLAPGAPTGASISSDGVFTWTPDLDQGPGEYWITVKVSDNGTPPLTATQTFKITVTKADITEEYARVMVDTTNGPVSIVISRRKYNFSPSGKTYYLSTNGNNGDSGNLEKPWKTFNYALNQLEPGDLLYVRQGEYPEPFVVDRSGTRFRPIILSVYPGERVRITQPIGWQTTNRTRPNIYLQNVSNVWIHGFEIEGCRGRADAPPIGDYGRNCISMSFSSGSGCRIINNTLTKAQQCGIRFWRVDGDMLVEGNLICENGIEGDGNGIEFTLSGIFPTVFRGNCFFENMASGLLVSDSSSNAVVYNNIFYANGNVRAFSGVMVEGQNNVVAHNVAVQNDGYGLILSKAQYCYSNSVLNNILSHNTQSQLFAADWYISPTNNIIDYCALYPESTWASPTDWYTNNVGPHMIISDPLLVNEPGLDFRLQVAGPGRNAAGPVILLGVKPQPDIGLFPATQYWEPKLTTIPTQFVDERKPFTIAVTLMDTNPPIDKVVFSLPFGAPSGATIDPNTGLFTWTPTEIQGPSINAITVAVCINDSSLLCSTTTFAVMVAEVNSPPVLNPIGNKNVNEGALLTFTVTATDSDIPALPLTFTLDAGAPTGAGITPSGVFTWTPTEAQGPITNAVTIRVGDGVTNVAETIQIVVNEVNVAPVLTVPADQTINELTTLTVTNSATDADIPANTLTFSLVSAPQGVTLDSATGVLAWTPTEAQGPSTNVIMVKVTDSGTPALSDSRSFTVFVREVNNPPILNPIGKIAANEETLLAFTVSATDQDIPVQALSFTLDAAPSGAAIDPVTGRFTWTPTEAQGPSTNMVTIRVSDGVTNAVETIEMVVNEENTAPSLVAIDDKTAYPNRELGFGINASDGDLPSQSLVFSLVTAPSGVVIDLVTGRFTWTPGPEMAGSSHTVTVQVSDNGSPPLTAQQSFTINVSSLQGLVLEVPLDQRIDELNILEVTNKVTDPEQLGRIMTFELIAAPTGMVIAVPTGQLTWTPTEDQGPSTNRVVVRVYDDGSPMRTATNAFVVVVNEVNSPPVLGLLTNQTARPNQTLSFVAAATDEDVPAQTLSFALDTAPSGAVIEKNTGLFNWMPTANQAPSTNAVVVRVTDGGSPGLSDTKTFTIVVSVAMELRILSVERPVDGQVELRWTAEPGAVYEVVFKDQLSDLTWTSLGQVPSAGDAVTFTNSMGTAQQRFYQIKQAR